MGKDNDGQGRDEGQALSEETQPGLAPRRGAAPPLARLGAGDRGRVRSSASLARADVAGGSDDSAWLSDDLRAVDLHGAPSSPAFAAVVSGSAAPLEAVDLSQRSWPAMPSATAAGPVGDSEELELNESDLEPLSELLEVAGTPSVEALALEAWEIEESVAPAQALAHLVTLLRRAGAMPQGTHEGSTSAQLRQTLVEDLDPARLDSRTLLHLAYAVVASLRQARTPEHGREAHLVAEALIAYDESFLPAYQDLVAAALAEGDAQALRWWWRRYAAAYLRRVPNTIGPGEPWWTLQALSLTLRWYDGEGAPAALNALCDAALAAGNDGRLPHLLALWMGARQGDGAQWLWALQRIIARHDGPLATALALDWVLAVWHGGDVASAVQHAEHLLSGPRHGAFPLALQPLAWRAGAVALEIDVCRAQVARWVALGQSPGLDGHEQARLRSGLAALFLRLAELHGERGDAARVVAALDDGLTIEGQQPLLLWTRMQCARRNGDHQGASAAYAALQGNASLGHGRWFWALDHGLWLASSNARNLADAEEALALAQGEPRIAWAASLVRAVLLLRRRAWEDFVELVDGCVEAGVPNLLGALVSNASLLRGDLLESMGAAPDVAYAVYAAGQPQDAFESRALFFGMERTAVQSGAYGELAAACAGQGAATTDRLVSSTAWWKAVQLMERARGDDAAALGHCLRYLELDPTDPQGLRALLRLYGRLWRAQGEPSCLSDAVAVIDSAGPHIAAPELQREIYQWRLWWSAWVGKAADQGFGAALVALQGEGSDAESLWWLSRHFYLTRRDWSAVVEAARALRGGAVALRRHALFQGGMICRLVLHDNTRARACFEAARAVDPAWWPAAEALEEVYREERDLEALTALLLESADWVEGPAASVFHQRVARLAESQEGQEAVAAAAWQRAIACDPTAWSAWQVHLEGCLRAGDWPRFQAAVTRCIDAGAPSWLSHTLRRERALWAELRREDAVARADWEALVAAGCEDATVHLALAENCWRQEAYGAAAVAYQNLAAMSQGTVALAYDRRAVACRVLAGEAMTLADVQGLYAAGWEAAKVRQLLRAKPPAPDEVDAYVALFERVRAQDGDDAIEDAVALGHLYEAAQAWEAAKAAYGEALHRCPGLWPAALALLRVLVAQGDHAGALTQAQALAAHLPPSPLQRRILQAAVGFAWQAQDWERVVSLWVRLLGDADDAELGALLSGVDAANAPMLPHLLGQLIDVAGEGDARERARLLGRLVASGCLAPYPELLATAREAMLRSAPEDETSLRALAALEVGQGRYAHAAAALERLLVHIVAPEAVRETSLQAADLWRGPAGKPERALAHYSELLRLRQDDWPVMLAQAETLQGLGRHDEARALWEEVCRSAPTPDLRRSAALALAAAARAHGAWQEVLRQATALLEVDGDDDAATELIIEALRHTGAAAGAEVNVAPARWAALRRAQSAPLRERWWDVALHKRVAVLLMLERGDDPRARLLLKAARAPLSASSQVAGPLSISCLHATDVQERLLDPAARGAMLSFLGKVSWAIARACGPGVAGLVPPATLISGSNTWASLQVEVEKVAAALGMAPPRLYVQPGAGVRSVLGEESGIVVGEESAPALVARSPALRFALAFALEGMRDGKQALTDLEPAQAESLMRGLIMALFPDFELSWTAGAGGKDAFWQLGEAAANMVPPRRRRELRHCVEAMAAEGFDFGAWLRGLRRCSWRSAVLLGQEVPWRDESATGADGAAAWPPEGDAETYGEILSFLLSDDFVLLWERLYGAGSTPKQRGR